MPLDGYLQLLRTNGTFIQVGSPEDGALSVPLAQLLWRRIGIQGSCIGSPDDVRDMLQLAADKRIKPWIEDRPMREANKAIVEMEEGNARYRYVLVNEQ